MTVDRRWFLAVPAAAMAVAAVHSRAAQRESPSRRLQSDPAPPAEPRRIRYALNTSTIRGQELSVPEQVEVAAAAGYDAIEPWMRELQAYVDGGGSLKDLRKRIEDHGMTVESAIGFARWIVDDPEERAAGLEEARRDMAMLREIGGMRIAAPPIGAHTEAGPDLATIAQRYRALLEVGREMEIVPQLELWGFSPTLSRLGELAYVAAEAGHPDACYLPDFYHIYKGGSDFAGLGLLEATRMHVFHMNDYPADPPRQRIADADRVYPGDGVAPLGQIIADLKASGFAGCFSLELFNPTYWQQPAEEVARTGLEKMRAVVEV